MSEGNPVRHEKRLSFIQTFSVRATDESNRSCDVEPNAVMDPSNGQKDTLAHYHPSPPSIGGSEFESFFVFSLLVETPRWSPAARPSGLSCLLFGPRQGQQKETQYENELSSEKRVGS